MWTSNWSHKTSFQKGLLLLLDELEAYRPTHKGYALDQDSSFDFVKTNDMIWSQGGELFQSIKMMFDDSMVAGGSNASMLNTSMKSEGGLSMLNTSRGEEVMSSTRSTVVIGISGSRWRCWKYQGGSWWTWTSFRRGQYQGNNVVLKSVVLGSIATSARAGDGRNHWHGSSARGGGERAGRGSNLQVFSGVCSIG